MYTLRYTRGRHTTLYTGRHTTLHTQGGIPLYTREAYSLYTREAYPIYTREAIYTLLYPPGRLYTPYYTHQGGIYTPGRHIYPPGRHIYTREAIYPPIYTRKAIYTPIHTQGGIYTLLHPGRRVHLREVLGMRRREPSLVHPFHCWVRKERYTRVVDIPPCMSPCIPRVYIRALPASLCTRLRHDRA